MRCTECGNELPQGAKFCNNCGSRVEQKNINQSERRFCGNCGAEIMDGSDICGNCGYDMRVGRCVKKPGKKTKPDKPHSKKRSKPAIIVASTTAVLLVSVAAVFTYIWYDKAQGIQSYDPQETILPEATAEPTDENNTSHNVGKMPTYYVANCASSIELYEGQSSSAKVLRNIPLGAPVSYVEAFSNGFAKVIYEGETGYVLQSYLSKNAEDIKKPTPKPTAAPTKAPAPSPTQTSGGGTGESVVSNPSYTTYKDKDFGFSCSYPKHFQAYNEINDFVRYSLKAPDNTATLKICAKKNKANLSPKSVLDSFKASNPGTVDYENKGDNWCAVSTIKNGECHYAYFKVTSGSIRGFELHYNTNYTKIYDKYVNDIYNSIKFD